MSSDGARGIWMGIYGEGVQPTLHYGKAWVCEENEHSGDGSVEKTDTHLVTQTKVWW